jgi:hypothetical protein
VFLLRRWRRLREGASNGRAAEAPQASAAGGVAREQEVQVASDFAVPFPRPGGRLAAALTAAPGGRARHVGQPRRGSLLAILRKPG